MNGWEYYRNISTIVRCDFRPYCSNNFRDVSLLFSSTQISHSKCNLRFNNSMNSFFGGNDNDHGHAHDNGWDKRQTTDINSKYYSYAANSFEISQMKFIDAD